MFKMQYNISYWQMQKDFQNKAGNPPNNPHRPNTHLDYLPDQAHDVFVIIGAVRIGVQLTPFVRLHVILSPNPRNP